MNTTTHTFERVMELGWGVRGHVLFAILRMATRTGVVLAPLPWATLAPLQMVPITVTGAPAAVAAFELEFNRRWPVDANESTDAVCTCHAGRR